MLHRRRRSAVAIRHVAFEDLGLLSPLLNAREWDVAYCDAAIADLSDPLIAQADLLIVLGGPIGVYETEAYPFLPREIEILEQRLSQDRPTLGICLSSQLMARALGSRVYPGPVKEIGWGSVALTDAGAMSCLKPLAQESAGVLHWHGDTFDLPHGAIRLASNDNYANQAFSFGRNALALQFHLEACPRQLEEWYIGHAAELAAAKIAVNDLRAATKRIADVARRQGDACLGAWLKETFGCAQQLVFDHVNAGR